MQTLPQGKCNDGFTGERCSEICERRCLTCSKENGDTCMQCKGAFYTTDCSLACKPSCKVEDGKITCRLTDGYCLNGCAQTFWGDHCNQSCSNGCINLACDRTTGKCVEGCKDGSARENCINTSTGYTEASKAFLSTTTSPTQLHQLNQLDNKSNNFIIGLFCGIGISVVIVVLILMLFLIRRRYLEKKQSQNDNNNANICTNYHTTTGFEAVGREQANDASNYESLSDQRDADTVYS
ncbi:multiple epidermal growth factor-like domains protein 10, partial [Ruditapes philippinarum]|uniref:multiple epidermal growth factor-like domains protein 10 n=1 Tax=Ruditapes philippinarum TaxID=129788 RepID=UPI00295B9781